MLKEKMKQVKEFVVEHKKEIAIGVLVVVGGVTVYKIVKSTSKITTIDLDSINYEYKDLEIPKLDVGVIDDLWEDNWGKSLILNDCTVADMGKLGEEFLKIDGITKDTVVTATVGLLNKVNDGVFLES